jgi:hypothetical protein
MIPMGEETKSIRDKYEVRRLKSPKGNPVNFEIEIREAGEDLEFRVIGDDSQTSRKRKQIYSLDDRSHCAYLDLFTRLSIDFGLRVPQNRLPLAKHSRDIPYSVVLTENLVPAMLYGYGDPAVIRVDCDGPQTGYYLVVTSNDAPNAFPVCYSSDLKDWSFRSFVFPEGETPLWAAKGLNISDYWAPEMHYVGNEFRVYFAARDKETLHLCIGMAKSAKPEGPFTTGEEPILKGNAIDPHIFSEDQETSFLFWKEDNNGIWPGKLIDFLFRNPGLIGELFVGREDVITVSFIQTLWPWIRTLRSMERFLVSQILIESIIPEYISFKMRLKALPSRADRIADISAILDLMTTPVYVQQLSSDGTRLVGKKTKIIENDLPWEAHLVEGMWVTRQHDRYYLFYAGNDFSTDQYGIGLAMADSLLGPYTKMEKPFLGSTNQWLAPGHPSIVKGPDNTYIMFLHAFFPQKAGYKEFRSLLSLPITFHEKGVSF